jgi:type VI secretion system secreted protein VgrG
MPPWDLPANATQSGTLTRSTKHGGYETANAIRFEDRKGNEQVWIHAEKDLHTEVENDELHSIDHDQTITVSHDRAEHVGNDEKVDIGQDRSHGVARDDTHTVGRNHTLTIAKDANASVGNNRTEKIASDYRIETGGHAEHTVQGHHRLQAGQSIVRKTQIYILEAGDKVIIKGPGGTISIDGSGITVEGMAIHLKGAVTQESGTGSAPKLMGTPLAGLIPDPSHLPLSE